MTQRQQYAVVPRDPVPAMLSEIALYPDFTAQALRVRYSALLKAAPPPPDHVLSYEEKIALVQQVRLESGGRVGIEEIEIIERDVLKQLGAKNV